MLIQGIPTAHIVHEAARRNKDYEVEFQNTESNNDMYTLKAYLRYGDNQYKSRLVLISSILAYPALEMIWVFKEDEYELASRVFHRICDEVDDVKTHYDQSMMPVATLAAQIREACKPISLSHQEKTNILWLDEAARLKGASDWRETLYRGQYPKMSKKDKERIAKLSDNHQDMPLKHRIYTTRQKY